MANKSDLQPNAAEQNRNNIALYDIVEKGLGGKVNISIERTNHNTDDKNNAPPSQY